MALADIYDSGTSIHTIMGLVSLTIAISTLCVAIKFYIQNNQINKSILAIILIIIYVEGLQAVWVYLFNIKNKETFDELSDSYTTQFITCTAVDSLYLSPLSTWIFIWEYFDSVNIMITLPGKESKKYFSLTKYVIFYFGALLVVLNYFFFIMRDTQFVFMSIHRV
jgi:hypothetical protein